MDEIRLGDLLKITANEAASRRTKNRIKENGDQFIFMRKSSSTSLFGGRTALLLRAISTNASNGSGGRENWLGWLPLNEIVFEDSELPGTEDVVIVKI